MGRIIPDLQLYGGTAHYQHEMWYIAGGTHIRPSKDKVTISMTIDSYLKSADRINYLCSKRNQILFVLSRFSIFITIEKQKKYNQTFIQSQFE